MKEGNETADEFISCKDYFVKFKWKMLPHMKHSCFREKDCSFTKPVLYSLKMYPLMT